MKQTSEQQTEAQLYLRDNADLRHAVGAKTDAVLEPHFLGVGEHNLNYWFQEPRSGVKYVLRVNVASQPFHDNQVAYEFAALKALEPSGCAPQAIYLDDSPAAPGKGVLVESFCDGEELNFNGLEPGQLECALQLMADVHAVATGDSCPLFRPSDPLRALFEECLGRFKVYRASAYEDSRITGWVERFIGRMEPALAASRPKAHDCQHIVNTEPLPSHFLIAADGAREAASCKDGGSGRFCVHPGAFIDWERPIVGEVAQDVAYFAAPTTTFWDSDWLCPAAEAERIVENYWRAVDGRFKRGSFDERYPLYRAMTVLRSTTWCCRALITYNRDDAHKVGKTAEKIPVYLSDDFLDRLYKECFSFQ